MTDDNAVRMDRILKVHGVAKDIELFRKFKGEISQPRISYWRNKGHYKSTAILIDSLLDIIEKQAGEEGKKR